MKKICEEKLTRDVGGGMEGFCDFRRHANQHVPLRCNRLVPLFDSLSDELGGRFSYDAVRKIQAIVSGNLPDIFFIRQVLEEMRMSLRQPIEHVNKPEIVVERAMDHFRIGLADICACQL